MKVARKSNKQFYGDCEQCHRFMELWRVGSSSCWPNKYISLCCDCRLAYYDFAKPEEVDLIEWGDRKNEDFLATAGDDQGSFWRNFVLEFGASSL